MSLQLLDVCVVGIAGNERGKKCSSVLLVVLPKSSSDQTDVVDDAQTCALRVEEEEDPRQIHIETKREQCCLRTYRDQCHDTEQDQEVSVEQQLATSDVEFSCFAAGFPGSTLCA